jgi:YD repeat-containing protein
MNKLKKFAPFAFIPVLLILLLAGKDRSLPMLKGSLSGRVINIQGEGIANAKLLLKSPSFQKDILTDGQGAFEVPALPTGVYEITTEPSGSGRPSLQEVAIHLGRESFVTLVTREEGLEEEELSNQVPAPRYVLDDQGRVISQETRVDDKFYYMEYSYDSYGRLKTATDNLNERWDYEYTDSGKIGEIRRTDGQSLLFNYDNEDSLWKVDLPWGYKIFYRKDENKFTKTVKKYKDLTLFEFSYSLDQNGNKIEVEEGAGRKSKFQYTYNNNDRLIEIKDMKSGEKNKSVFKRKGKILNASLFGQIILKDGKYQDKAYEYGFDERGNIIYQKNKSSPVEVIREFDRRNLLTRETYLFQSSPVLSIEYKYDIFGRLLLKSIDNGISYYYFRDKDGQVTHKVMRNMLTGEEIDGVSYTPSLSDFDQDGFELIKYKDREKLFVRDAEGNRRYMVEIFDVLRYSTHYHQRNVHTDGDFSREIEYMMSQILERIHNPSSSGFDLLREFFDLPLENPAESGEGMVTIQSAASGDVGCYNYGWCAPQYSYCVDCGTGGGGGGGGEEPGSGGGSSDCMANISGPTQVMVNDHVTYNLSTNCLEPSGFNWGGGEGANSGTTSYSTWWISSGYAIVTVSFSYSPKSIWVWNEEKEEWYVDVQVISKTASLDVHIYEDDQPPPPPPPSDNEDKELTIMIVDVRTPSGGDSFIANRLHTGDDITVAGIATYGTSDVSNQITWTCADNPYDSIVSGTAEARWGTTGSGCSFIPVPPAALTGRTAPLSYLITAQIIAGGKIREDAVTIRQDNLDELRQEYEDLEGRISQTRGNFDQDAPAYAGLLDPPDVEYNRHQWLILRSLNRHALDANSYYTRHGAGDIAVTSGYRCPIGNLRAGGAANSNHQYGKAFDFDQGSSIENYNAFLAACRIAGARADTYLKASNGKEYYWRSNFPPPPDQLPPGVTYIRGHAAWDN